MAKVVFKSYNQNDNLLFPPCLGDFIADNDPVRVLNAVVDHLDIRSLEDSYEGGGASSYHPRMLLKVVFYAYLQNVYSGRKMEQLLRRDVNFMWLSGMQVPDFNTINLFRRNRLAPVVDDLFTQVVEMLVENKFVSLEVQYIDGTKIEANANRYTFVWKKATKTNREKLDKKVKDVLSEAERQLNMELAEKREEVMSSSEMAERTERILEKMDEAGVGDKALRKAVKSVKEESVAKMKEYEDKLEVLGERNSYSKTDHDASFMRIRPSRATTCRYPRRTSSLRITPHPGGLATGALSFPIWTPSRCGSAGRAGRWSPTPATATKRTTSIWRGTASRDTSSTRCSIPN